MTQFLQQPSAGKPIPDTMGVASRKNHKNRHVTKTMSSPLATIVALLIAVLWTIPTLGLLITSFRPQKDILTSGWWTVFTHPSFTFSNYVHALTSSSDSMLDYFVNSIVIAIPSTLFPLVLATLAAYGFAWIDFKGRNWLFVAVFALQVVPLQVALIPLMRIFVATGLAGSFWPVWITHTIFGLPLAVFMLNNAMRDVPHALFEAAHLDGASHVQIFLRIALPLCTPMVASYGIFQFLWTWNDLLVGLTFLGTSAQGAPLTAYIANLSGSRGSAWHLLSSGAFISMIVPLIIFLCLQRYFVRGLVAGAVK